MTLRIFGAATVVVCCSLIGLRCAGGYSQRVKLLRSLIGTVTVAPLRDCRDLMKAAVKPCRVLPVLSEDTMPKLKGMN